MPSVWCAVRLYDILIRSGEDLRPLPFDERRRHLEIWFGEQQPVRMDLSDLVPFDSWEELAGQRSENLTVGVEGLMLKRSDSAYLPGRPKGPWFKWKRDPHLIDAVLMYAQRGHGKRSSFYSDYTFGVWRGKEIVPVGKAYFGFTDEELQQLDKWVRNNGTERFGPVRAVKQELVCLRSRLKDCSAPRATSRASLCGFPASHASAGTNPPPKPTSSKRSKQSCRGKPSRSGALRGCREDTGTDQGASAGPLGDTLPEWAADHVRGAGCRERITEVRETGEVDEGSRHQYKLLNSRLGGIHELRQERDKKRDTLRIERSHDKRGARHLARYRGRTLFDRAEFPECLHQGADAKPDEIGRTDPFQDGEQCRRGGEQRTKAASDTVIARASPVMTPATVGRIACFPSRSEWAMTSRTVGPGTSNIMVEATMNAR